MVKLNSKIKGFTILESMVSMVIIIIIFSLSSILIMNVSSSGMSREKQNAYMLVKSYRDETIRTERLIDEAIEVNDFIIKKTILDYGKGEELNILKIEAFKEDEKLFEIKEIVLSNVEL